MKSLTDLAIKKLPHPSSGSEKHLDPSLPGFGIRCTSRSKSYFVMYGPDRRLKTLGKWPDIPLRDARKAAKKLLASPPAIQIVPYLDDIKEQFLTDCRIRLRESTVERYHYALKDIDNVKLDKINTDIDDPNQLKALKVLFNWCIDRGITDKNPFIRRKVRFATRDRLLTDNEIAAIWNVDQRPYSDIVKLLVLTGQRRNQIWKFDPSWIDGDELTFPASIMKSNAPHTIPITGYRQYLPGEPFSFNSWSKSKRRLDAACGVSDWVLHDFRRYFSSTMARLGTPLHITELILDHRAQLSGVAAIYNRYDYLKEMRVAFEEYERHIFSIADAA